MMRIYRHYKNKELYRVLVPDAKREEDGATVVVYQNLNPDKPQVWTRLESVFNETVKDEEGNMVPRFRSVTSKELTEEMYQAMAQKREEDELLKTAQQVDIPKDGNIAGVNPHYHKN